MVFKVTDAGRMGLLGALLRAWAVPPVVGDVDGVNFARGLADFDPLRQSPHLPGYPVYMALAKLAAGLGLGEVGALVAPAIALWPGCALLLYVGARRQLGEAPAIGVVIVASLAPGAVLAGGWPGSDGLGACLLAAFAGALGLALPSRDGQGSAGWGVGAGLLFGLALGVRVSWSPLLGTLLGWGLWRSTRRLPLLAGACVGGLIWLVPLALLVGPQALIRGSAEFLAGHLSGWGGALFSDAERADPGGALERWARAGWGVWHAGLGAAWIGPIPLAASGAVVDLLGGSLALLLGWGILAGWWGDRRWPLLVLALPYLVWVVYGQNVARPRHLMPLLPFVGALVMWGLRGRRLAISAGALAALLSGSALTVAAAQRAPAPAAALVGWVRSAHSPAELQIFAGAEARLFEHLAPAYRVLRPGGVWVLRSEVGRLRRLGVEVWITSGVARLAAARLPLERLAHFEQPLGVRGPDAALSLYRIGGGR